MVVSYEELEGVTFDQLEVGDEILAYRHVMASNHVEYSPSDPHTYVITEIISEHGRRKVYWGELNVWSGTNHLCRVRRAVTVNRIPCVKCGKLLHPSLSASAGVTHGC